MMNNENGRSMVEMLGVLAIIGVLSVAGIAGYTMAMNKYRANEILNTASQAVMLAKARNLGAGDSGSLNASSDLALTLPTYITGMTVTGSNGDTPTVAVTGTSGGSTGAICTAVEAASPGTGIYTITCS